MTEQSAHDAPVLIAPGGQEASKEDIEAVTRAALDYIEGFTEGDAERHARAYHPECVKRRFVTDEGSGMDELHVLSPRIMVDHARCVGSTYEHCPSEIVVDAISEGIASVRVYSCQWVDFLHVARARGEWKLFHVTWHDRTNP